MPILEANIGESLGPYSPSVNFPLCDTRHPSYSDEADHRGNREAAKKADLSRRKDGEVLNAVHTSPLDKRFGS